MDPDAEAEQAASKILQTIFIIVAFSSCYNKERHTTVPIVKKEIVHQAPEVKTPVIKKNKVLKKKKTIYLTFDDGPNKGTKNVMHIAEAEKMPITMFLIGEQVYGSHWQARLYDSLLANNLIELQNHSYCHAHSRYRKFYSCTDSVIKDFYRCADSLQLTSKIIRTPGRNIWRTGNISSTDIKNCTDVADSLCSEGFELVGWDLEWHFDKDLALQNTNEELLKQVDTLFAKRKMKTPDHLVLLAHDQMFADANDSCELHEFMNKLKSSDDYNFETISNYPGIKN